MSILGGIVGGLIEPVKDLISEAIVDPDKRAEINVRLTEIADRADQRIHEQMVAQTEVNKVEAGHRSIFVAGWRPAIGWGCGAALVYNTLIAPMFGLGQADLPFLQTILMGMLGIAGMRSFDKYAGTSNDVLPIRRPKAAPVNELPPGFGTPPENTPWEK